MKITVLTFQSHKEPWFQEIQSLYLKKISPLMAFEYLPLKTPKIDRGDSAFKRSTEGDLLLKQLKPDDFVVLLDEKGRSMDSRAWAQWMEKGPFQSSAKRLVFIVGGAYGVDDRVIEKARIIFQMGPWTLNHLVAQAVLFEQIYRALTLIQGLPYHND